MVPECRAALECRNAQLDQQIIFRGFTTVLDTVWLKFTVLIYFSNILPPCANVDICVANERLLSCMKRIKTYLHTATGDERLSDYLVIAS